MGFFDRLTNMSADENEGLLAAAATMLQAGGPSRQPIGFGQAAGASLQAFQQGKAASRDQRMQEEQARMAIAMRALQMRNAESDLNAQEQQRARAEQLRQFYMEDGQDMPGAAPTAANAQALEGMQAQQPQQGQPGGTSPFMQRMAAMGSSAPAAGRYGAQEYHDAALQAGLPNPGSMGTSNAIVDRVNRLGETPDVAARALSGGQQGAQSPGMTAAPPSPGGRNSSVYQERMAMAQRLRARGFAQEADAQEAAALKFQPKVKGWEKVQQGGKVMYAPFFEDGTSGQPVPLEVAEKLEKVNTGGSTELVNAYTGATVRGLTNTVSPDAQLSASTTMRGQNMSDARARDALDVQRSTSKVPPGYRMQLDGSLAPIPGGPADPRAGKEGLQRTQDARDVLSILDEAEPLLKKSTAGYLGTMTDMVLRGGGVATGGGEAAAQLKVLQGALVSKMPKMSGPQSDKDVQLYREMAGQIGDSTLPASQRAAAMKTIRSLNEKYLGSVSAPAQPQQSGPRAPMKGQVVKGYRFKGGDPADSNNWEPK